MTRAKRNLGLILGAAAIALITTLVITWQVFGGVTDFGEFIASVTAQQDYLNLILINLLVGVSVALFVVELRWQALRVIGTVAFALLLGYFVTFIFNLDSANRFASGQFKVLIVSDAPPVENADMDLEYGQTRGGEFNKQGVAEPLRIAEFRFEGSAGDMISALAFAGSRNSAVNLQLAILDEAGNEIGAATGATPEQVQAFEDLRSENDAVLQGLNLPADGVYVLVVQPEPIPTGVTLSEAFKATNEAYKAFLLGPISRPNRWAIWIQDSFTLIMVGIAIAIVFQAEQFSLGAEGQLYLGALVSGIIALNMTNVSPLIAVPLALIGAAGIGFLYGLLPGALKAYLGANELVSTLMLNVVALKFFDLVLANQLKPPEAGFNSSAMFPASAVLPPVVGGSQVTIAIFIVVGVVLFAWYLLTRTPLGYEIRMVGSNLKFAAYGGVNTKRTIMLSMAISGAVAGLAGAHLSMGIFRQLVQNMSFGLAFEGVVVALLARNNPLVIPFTGLLYAYLRAGAQFMERDANVSFEIVRVIQAIIILLITAEGLLSFSRKRKSAVPAPAAPPPAPASAVEGAANV
ncbi:MAG: ABC transporter permease [Anaerolineae bacterium]|nr:ABC transporter permease [Anaerolineae bacterium]